MIVKNIEYVPDQDTLADITLSQTTSASLRTSNAILLACLFIAAFFLNGIFIATVLGTKKLRISLIYKMYCLFSAVNLIDLTLTVLFSLLFVANGSWMLGTTWCRINAAMQEFTQIFTLLTFMVMCSERAIGLVTGSASIPVGTNDPSLTNLINGWKTFGFFLFIAGLSIAIASPTLTSLIPVKPFKNRYLCAINSGCPLAYVITRVVLYIGTLSVLLICISAILRKRDLASLPFQTHDNSAFIKRHRAMQEHTSRAKLVIMLLCVFILLEGPYITLCFVFEMSNSAEFSTLGDTVDVPQDADTLITWLRFVFPLLSPIIMFCWCNDIWISVKEIFCCRSYEPPTIGDYINGMKVAGSPGVMTLVATSEGLQLKLPAPSQQFHAPTPIYAPALPTGPFYPDEEEEAPVKQAIRTPPRRTVRPVEPSVEVPGTINDSTPSSSTSDANPSRKSLKKIPKPTGTKGNAAPKTKVGGTSNREAAGGVKRRQPGRKTKAAAPPQWRS